MSAEHAPDYEHPVGPVTITTTELLSKTPHRLLQFPSLEARDAFLGCDVRFLGGVQDNDTGCMQFSVSGHEEYNVVCEFTSLMVLVVHVRGEMPNSGVLEKLDDFIVRQLYPNG